MTPAEAAKVLALTPGSLLIHREIEKAVNSLEHSYVAKGYVQFRADVNIDWIDPSETPDDGSADLVFKVFEGATFDGRTIASIDFRGNEQLSSEDLKGAMKYARVGEPYKREKLMIDIDRLRVLVYADRGFCQAHFKEAEIDNTLGGINVVVPLTEGRQYRIGKISVEHCTLLNSSEAVHILGLNTGEIVRGSQIHEGQEKLKALYEARGYIQFNSDLDITWTDPYETPLEGTADLVFIFEEGKQFCLRSITFAGTYSTVHKSVRELFRIHDGEYYNPHVIEEGVRELNRLGRFEHVNPDDWKSVVDEQAAQVDIVIALKDKASQP